MFSICSMYGIYLPIYMKTTNCKLFFSCIYRYSQIFLSRQNAHLSKLGDDDWCHFDAPGRKWFECLELLRAEPFRIAQHGPAQRWTVTSVHGFGVSATHRWCGVQPCAESQCVRQPWWETGWILGKSDILWKGVRWTLVVVATQTFLDSSPPENWGKTNDNLTKHIFQMGWWKTTNYLDVPGR